MFFKKSRLNKKKTLFSFFDNESLKKIHKRIFFSTSIFFLIYLSIFIRLTDIMIISNLYDLDKEKYDIVINSIVKERGKIFDRNGELLATTVRSYSLSANPLLIKNKEKVAKELSKIFRFNEKEILTKISTNTSFLWIKRDISPTEHYDINAIGEIGLTIHKEKQRFYPQSSLVSHIVGLTNIDEMPLSGIEKGMNEKLKNNQDIYLSIDLRLQNLITEELKMTIKKFDAIGGVSIILDIENGQILASSSLPNFDPNNINLSPTINQFNIATHGVFDMGSTFKPITMAIAFDSETVDDLSKFEVNEPITIGRFSINDYKPLKGPLNIREIIVNSSNIGAAKVAKLIGKNKQKKYLKKFGLLERQFLEIPETGNPIVPNPWLPINTMTIGYGYGLSVSPMQLCSAYSTLVNGGTPVKPTLLKDSKTKYLPQAISQSTSKKIRELLRAVILETKYTGPRAKVAGYEVGGKTGTAELLEKGKYLKKANLSSFIGVFPISEPKYVVLVMIKNPQGIKETFNFTTGAWVAAPTVSRIIKRMINILGIKSKDNNETFQADLDIHNIFKYETL